VLVVAAPALAHFAFSSLGFPATDEGFVLAYSRRILAGQVPHRDFIFIRPAGSPIAHLLEAALGASRRSGSHGG